jgi:hypothetical protein
LFDKQIPFLEEKNEQEINTPRILETLGDSGHGCRWCGDSERVRACANRSPPGSNHCARGSNRSTPGSNHCTRGSNYSTSRANCGAQTHGSGF